MKEITLDKNGFPKFTKENLKKTYSKKNIDSATDCIRRGKEVRGNMDKIEEIVIKIGSMGHTFLGEYGVCHEPTLNYFVEQLTTLIQDEVKGFVKWNLKEDIKIQGSSLTLGASPEELLEARMEKAERYLNGK